MSGVRIDVRDNIKQAVAALEKNTGAAIDKAIPRALNGAATTVRADGSRALRDSFPGMTAARLKRRIKIERARVGYGNQTATVVFSALRFRLFSNFAIKRIQTKYGTGISASTKIPFELQIPSGKGAIATYDRSAGGEVFRRAFLARSRRTGQSNVWIRTGKGRMPISVVLVSGVAVALKKQHLEGRLASIAQARFLTIFKRNLKFTGG